MLDSFAFLSSWRVNQPSHPLAAAVETHGRQLACRLVCNLYCVPTVRARAHARAPPCNLHPHKCISNAVAVLAGVVVRADEHSCSGVDMPGPSPPYVARRRRPLARGRRPRRRRTAGGVKRDLSLRRPPRSNASRPRRLQVSAPRRAVDDVAVGRLWPGPCARGPVHILACT